MPPSLNDFKSTIERHLAGLWSDGRGWILVVLGAGWFLLMGVRLLYPSLLPILRADLNLDLTISGFLLTSLWIAYAVGQLPGGLLGDRIGEGNILVASMAISTGTLLLISGSYDFATLLAGTVAFGFASALYSPTRFAVLTSIYTQRAGSAIGLTMAAGSVGNTILPVTAVFIAINVGWRSSFLVLVPLFAVVTFGLWRAVPSRTTTSADSSETNFPTMIRRIWVAIRHDSIPVVAVINVMVSLVYQGFVSFYPSYLTDVKGLTAGVAAALFGVFFAASILVQLLAGVSRDRFGSRPTLLAILSLVAIGLWLLPFAEGYLKLVPLTIILSSLSGYGVITQTFIADALPDDITNSALGTLRTGFILVGSISPSVIGYLGDHGFFVEAFGLLALLATGGAIITFFLMPPPIKDV